jgi:hypothetical protein
MLARNRSAGLHSSLSLPRKEGRDDISGTPTGKWLRPAPKMCTGALEEILVCCGDHFAVDPARRGVAADSAPGNCSAT